MAKRHQLVRKDSLSEEQLAAAIPAEFDEINMELLVELMLPTTNLQSRTQLRMQLEDEMAAAMEKAMLLRQFRPKGQLDLNLAGLNPRYLRAEVAHGTLPSEAVAYAYRERRIDRFETAHRAARRGFFARRP